MVHVIERNYLLIELEEMNLVGPHLLHLILVLVSLRSIQHSNAGLGEVVRHRELRVPIETDVILVLANLLIVHSIYVALCPAVVALRPSTSVPISVRIGRVRSTSTAVVRPRAPKCIAVGVTRLSLAARSRAKPVLVFICQIDLLEKYLVRLDIAVVHD
jgi:hypothetical protein